jgi:hypothetical protein
MSRHLLHVLVARRRHPLPEEDRHLPLSRLLERERREALDVFRVSRQTCGEGEVPGRRGVVPEADVVEEPRLERELPALRIALEPLPEERQTLIGPAHFLAEHEGSEDHGLEERRVQLRDDPGHVADPLEAVVGHPVLAVVLDAPEPAQIGGRRLVAERCLPHPESRRVVEELLRPPEAALRPCRVHGARGAPERGREGEGRGAPRVGERAHRNSRRSKIADAAVRSAPM